MYWTDMMENMKNSLVWSYQVQVATETGVVEGSGVPLVSHIHIQLLVFRQIPHLLHITTTTALKQILSLHHHRMY